MHVRFLLAFVVLSGCASSGAPSTTAAKPATQTISSPGMGSMTLATANAADVVTVPYAPDAVWRIMPSVFDSLAIPVTVMNQASKQIGNNAFKTRQKLGKVSLSRYLDCGTTQIGPNADSYDVVLGVTTTITAGTAPNTSVLTTMVEAQSKPVMFNQAYSRCSSKGGIESRLTDLVKTRLSK